MLSILFRKSIQLSIITLSVLTGCAELDEGLRKSSDRIAPRDPVTGKRVLNLESEAEEVQRAERQKEEIINSAKMKGYAVDADKEFLSHLHEMMYGIAFISHRPNLPWEVHLIESPEVNAFAIGGGKIFFYRGLFRELINPSDDNEIAAVMAHEMAHITAKHLGERQGERIAGALSKKAQKATAGRLYQASFTTLQEDEADKIGLLYMSLAGYDPSTASRVWLRADKKYGSDPHDYAYDHSLNADRAKKIAQSTPIALEYFKGQDTVNNDYEQILASNKLLPRKEESETESGYVAALGTALDTFSQHLDAKNEELSRRVKIQQEQIDAQRFTRLDMKIANTTSGYRALTGHLLNISNKAIMKATVTVFYVNAAGQPIYSENIALTNVFLSPGQKKDWSAYVKEVPGAAHIQARVTRIEWAN